MTVLAVSLEDPKWPARLNKVVPEVTSVGSWVLLNQLFAPVVRRLPLPRLLGALVYGAGLNALDDALTSKGLAAAGERAATAGEEPTNSD